MITRRHFLTSSAARLYSLYIPSLAFARADNKMDGVPGLTQSPVFSGRDFLYDFMVPDTGTYWYHSHDRSWEQVARGLYGALIVEEENPPLVDHDIIWKVGP